MNRNSIVLILNPAFAQFTFFSSSRPLIWFLTYGSEWINNQFVKYLTSREDINLT